MNLHRVTGYLMPQMMTASKHKLSIVIPGEVAAKQYECPWTSQLPGRFELTNTNVDQIIAYVFVLVS